MQNVYRVLFAVLAVASYAPAPAFAQAHNHSGRISAGLYSALLSNQDSSPYRIGYHTYGLGVSVQAQLNRRISVGIGGEAYQATSHNTTGFHTQADFDQRTWTAMLYSRLDLIRWHSLKLYGTAGTSYLRIHRQGTMWAFKDFGESGWTEMPLRYYVSHFGPHLGGGIALGHRLSL